MGGERGRHFSRRPLSGKEGRGVRRRRRFEREIESDGDGASDGNNESASDRRKKKDFEVKKKI